jgi:hypothetical protein
MAKHPLHSRRESIFAWLTANGINPSHVPQDADITISEGTGGRLLRCEVFDLTPDGQRQLDERGEKVAVTVVAAPLKVEPPTWWQPYIKPTRDQLLAAADRVRALHRRNENTAECEYCSARDYPDYAVPFPCDTIKALEGEK